MTFTHILNSLHQTITISTAGDQDMFAKVTYATGTDYPCRFQKVTKNIIQPNNEFTPINALVWLGPDAVVAKDDKATFGSDDYKVMSVEPMIDKYGNTRHYELALQDWKL